MLEITPEKLLIAVSRFAQVWGDGWLASEIGPRLTCNELDALADLLVCAGDLDGATTWVMSHAESKSEEENDAHFEWTPEGAELELCERVTATA